MAGGRTKGLPSPGVRLVQHPATVGCRKQVVAENLAGRACGHDPAPFEQDQLVGQRRGEVQVVEHGNERRRLQRAWRRMAASTSD